VKHRPLGPEEAALWARVLSTVRPLPGRQTPRVEPAPFQSQGPVPERAITAASPPAMQPGGPATPALRPHHHATLDSGWDRRLSRGIAQPDCVVDLHGHSLATAYTRLDIALDQAIAQGHRLMLLITGKPPRPDSERPHARGAIRDAVGDWLTASRHASRIAAVRNAHPRHGGAGALYIVFRRQRAPHD